MFHAGPLGVMTVGGDGAIQDANPVFLRASGYEVGELMLTQFSDLWCDEDQTAMRQNVTALDTESDDRSAGVRRFRSRSGNLLSASVTFALIRDWDENPHHFLVMMEGIAPLGSEPGVQQRHTGVLLARLSDAFATSYVLFIVVVSVGVLIYPSLPARAPRSHHDFFPLSGTFNYGRDSFFKRLPGSLR